MTQLRNVATFLDEILEAIQTKIATTDQLLDSHYVALSLSEELAEPSAKIDRYLLIVPGPQRPDQAVIAGAGNDAPYLKGEVGLVLWTRIWLDSGHIGDKQAMTSATRTRGTLKMMRLLMKSLQLFDPTNGDGDYLLGEPMRLSDGGWMTRKPKGPASYEPLSASFEISYLADLTS